ncbi:MAG: hypothetical protein ACT4P7_16080 [Gemmatimonadaceae bacterium]
MNRSNSHALEDDFTTTRPSVAEPLLHRAERLKAALGDTVDEQLRVARRAVRRTQHAAEDLADGVRLQTRREPMKSLGIALGVGALIGLMIGWGARKR